MVVAAAEIKVFELKLEFELPQKRSKIHFHGICHFVFFWSITLKLSIKLVLCCLFLHLCNKFKVSNFDWHDWRTVAWVLTDLNSFKAAFLTWLQITPIFAHWLKCAIGCLLCSNWLSERSNIILKQLSDILLGEFERFSDFRDMLLPDFCH